MNVQPEHTTVETTHCAQIFREVILVRAMPDILEMVEAAEVNKTLNRKVFSTLIILIFQSFFNFYKKKETLFLLFFCYKRL